MTSADEWKRAVTEAIAKGFTERSALLSNLQSQFPTADPKTVAEKVSRFAERDRARQGYYYVLRGGPRPPRNVTSTFPPDSGRGWFERFVKHGLAPEGSKGFRETPDGNTPWTKFILSLTHSIGKDEGFLVREKPELNRWDQSWLNSSGRPIVVIEHENDPETGSGLTSELDHLVPSDAPLKVLITYYPQSRLVASATDLAGAIQERLRSHGNFHGEFLLMVARWEIDDVRDFRAYLLRPDWVSDRL